MSPQKLCFLLAFRVSHAATLSGIVAGSVGVATRQDRQLVRPASTKHLMRRQSTRDGQIAQPAPRTVVEKVDIATKDGKKHTVLVYEGGSQPPLCEDANYHAFMKQACAKAEQFKIFQNMQTRRSCKYDEVKGRIDCDLERVCQGGELSSWRTKSVFHHATFQCKKCDKDGKILRWACCHECKRLKEQATAYWNDPENMEPVKMNGFDLTDVQCPDCQQEELDAIAGENDDFCARGESGAFYCHVTGQCHTGEPSSSTKEEEQLCVNTPCDECEDEVLRAKCCARCLSAVCKPVDDGTPLRQVCTGCFERLLNVFDKEKVVEEKEREPRKEEPLEKIEKDEEEKEELIEEKTPAGPDEERLTEPATGPDEQEVDEASAPAGPDEETLSGPPAGPDEQDKEGNTHEESLDEQEISEEDDRSGEDTPTSDAE